MPLIWVHIKIALFTYFHVHISSLMQYSELNEDDQRAPLILFLFLWFFTLVT